MLKLSEQYTIDSEGRHVRCLGIMSHKQVVNQKKNEEKILETHIPNLNIFNSETQKKCIRDKNMKYYV